MTKDGKSLATYHTCETRQACLLNAMLAARPRTSRDEMMIQHTGSYSSQSAVFCHTPKHQVSCIGA
jgi:hypothetical protein